MCLSVFREHHEQEEKSEKTTTKAIIKENSCLVWRTSWSLLIKNTFPGEWFNRFFLAFFYSSFHHFQRKKESKQEEKSTKLLICHRRRFISSCRLMAKDYCSLSFPFLVPIAHHKHDNYQQFFSQLFSPHQFSRLNGELVNTAMFADELNEPLMILLIINYFVYELASEKSGEIISKDNLVFMR